jgi:UDP-N-acetylglucosamine 2-epimerase (non-hydrolysing)
MKVGIVLGTRPEIIKMAPVIRLLDDRRSEYFIIHSNQHYSYNMDAVFFEELNNEILRPSII